MQGKFGSVVLLTVAPKDAMGLPIPEALETEPAYRKIGSS